MRVSFWLDLSALCSFQHGMHRILGCGKWKPEEEDPSQNGEGWRAWCRGGRERKTGEEEEVKDLLYQQYEHLRVY